MDSSSQRKVETLRVRDSSRSLALTPHPAVFVINISRVCYRLSTPAPPFLSAMFNISLRQIRSFNLSQVSNQDASTRIYCAGADYRATSGALCAYGSHRAPRLGRWRPRAQVPVHLSQPALQSSKAFFLGAPPRHLGNMAFNSRHPCRPLPTHATSPCRAKILPMAVLADQVARLQ